MKKKNIPNKSVFIPNSIKSSIERDFTYSTIEDTESSYSLHNATLWDKTQQMRYNTDDYGIDMRSFIDEPFFMSLSIDTDYQTIFTKYKLTKLRKLFLYRDNTIPLPR